MRHRLLTSWAQLLTRLAGAERVSLCLPAAPGTPGAPRLVHSHSRPAVPELADAGTAAELERFAAGGLAGPGRARGSRRRRAVVTLPSAAPGGWLIAVPPEPRPLAAAAPSEGRAASRRKADRRAPGRAPALWVGLRFAPAAAGDFAGEDDGLWRRALAHAANLAAVCRRLDAVVRDPVTELPRPRRLPGGPAPPAGRLAEAAGSTVILDEIGELPLEVQSKLLRFVQEKEIMPVGGTRPRTVDARLVAVTHRDLAAEVAAGNFRQDLYYRLKVVHLHVPPLAERPEDVPLLIDHFARRFAARYHKEVRGLDPEAAALAARYPWPGNVRELENRILQAVILCDGEEIGPQDLALDLEAAGAAGPRGAGPQEAGTETMELDLEQVEKRHIERILASEHGAVEQAARRLGIHRGTLYRKMKRFGIESDGSPAADP